MIIRTIKNESRVNQGNLVLKPQNIGSGKKKCRILSIDGDT